MSNRLKVALRTAIAMALAYGFSLWMDWDRTYWAGLAVGLCALATDGESLNKGLLRIFGTGFAIVVLIALLSVLHQERLPTIFWYAVYIFFCAFMMAGTRNWYFWFHAGFLVAVIGTATNSDPVTTFDLVVLRGQQTLAGISIYTLVSAVLFPTTTGDVFKSKLREQIDTLDSLLHQSIAAYRGDGDEKALTDLKNRAAQQQAALPSALDAATLDTLQIFETRSSWRSIILDLGAALDAVDRWTLGFTEYANIPADERLRNLPEFVSEIQKRISGARALLDDQTVSYRPESVNLVLPVEGATGISHFARASLILAKDQLADLERATRGLFDALAQVRGVETVPAAAASAIPSAFSATPAGLIPDPERVASALRAVTGFLLAALFYIYITDVPFWNVLIINTCAAGMMSAMITPQLSPLTALLPMLNGALYAGLIHIFIMPHLAGYLQLSIVIFIAVFLIVWTYHKPQQVLGKSLALVMFVTATQIDNQQTYSFTYVANAVIANLISIAILVVCWYFPFNFTPQHSFPRLLRRFFQSSSSVLDSMDRAGSHHGSWFAEQLHQFHQRQVATLAPQLETWARALPEDAFNSGERKRLEELVASLAVLSKRIRDLLTLQQAVHSDDWTHELGEEVKSWRQIIQGFLSRMSQQPEALDPAELKRRLSERIARMEAQLVYAVDRRIGDNATEEETVNMYRLLGAYRGVSEALNNVVTRTHTVDWQRFREARF